LRAFYLTAGGPDAKMCSRGLACAREAPTLLNVTLRAGEDLDREARRTHARLLGESGTLKLNQRLAQR